MIDDEREAQIIYFLFRHWGARHLIGYYPARALLIGLLVIWRIGSTHKATIHYANFRASFAWQPFPAVNNLREWSITAAKHCIQQAEYSFSSCTNDDKSFLDVWSEKYMRSIDTPRELLRSFWCCLMHKMKQRGQNNRLDWEKVAYKLQEWFTVCIRLTFVQCNFQLLQSVGAKKVA